MVIYVMAHILLSSKKGFCIIGIIKEVDQTTLLLPFYSQTQALDVCGMYGLALYLLNNLTSSLLYATALFLS